MKTVDDKSYGLITYLMMMQTKQTPTYYYN